MSKMRLPVFVQINLGLLMFSITQDKHTKESYSQSLVILETYIFAIKLLYI
jgi:hypothetical protein